MNYWLTTDTHFGHVAMLTYCGRPEGFEELIFKGFRKLNSDDILIHLGDVCIGKDAEWHKRITDLPFKKFLVRGNHDQKPTSWYQTHGWDFAAERFDLIFEGRRVCFSHVPTKYNNDFDINIHGHFHNSLHRLQEGRFVVEGEKERNEIDLKNLTPRHKLLALEYTNYQPVMLKHLLTSKKPE